ncbi:MAG TPA: thiamine-phosphate kinase [Sandaracinaceae bacterium LLY-WYZ-13_1]|nr:thiamine-phosphate kinase [Sandaracinaceae bacterium LLY-WYZ-13_1]
MDEFELIDRIRARLARDAPRVRIGIGDDAAVLAPLSGGIVISVDAVVDGVHFDRRWLGWPDVGWRGWCAALSDLAAMGAPPVAGVLSLVVPSDEDEANVLAMIGGVAEAADAFDAPVVGGNVSGGRQLALHSTVIGEAPAEPLRRAGARVGDAVWVTGTVGAAALGWRLLEAGRADDPEAAPFVARWRRPRPRFDVMDAVRSVASAGIDVSDGVLQDLGHVCEASGVGADVELARLPRVPGHRSLAARVDADPDALAAGGGEDFELLFTAPPAAGLGGVATRIGTVRERGEGPPVRALDADGRERAVARAGHRHFGA